MKKVLSSVVILASIALSSISAIAECNKKSFASCKKNCLDEKTEAQEKCTRKCETQNPDCQKSESR
jgi:hypothetical protein